MRRTLFGFVTLLASCIASVTSFGQPQTAQIVGAQFDVVSIKPHQYEPGAGGGMVTLPDGTFKMTSQPIWCIANTRRHYRTVSA